MLVFSLVIIAKIQIGVEDHMSPNNVRTRGERMREHGSEKFTGRTKETEVFEQTIDAIKKQSKKELEKVKTAFNIYGEGGMGKTWLLWEYERICRNKNIVPIYFDIRLWDEPSISSIVDFLKILRKHLGQSVPLQKFLGSNPFANFDQCYARYMGLDELRKRDEAKNNPTPSTAERLSKLGTKMALGVGKFIPYVNEAAELVGKDNVEEAADIARESLLNSVQDFRARLQRVFNNNNDVQFYLDHQDELINSLVNVISDISAKYYLVILMDSYEEILPLDVELREKFFNLLPENVVLVLSGRNSIHDNCSPAWREDMHFFEMHEFSSQECDEYLEKRKIKSKELARTIWDFTQGMPLAAALTADIYDELSGNVKETLKIVKGTVHGKLKDRREWIIEHITERFLNLVPDNERRIIDACAVLGQMSVDTIEFLLEDKLSKNQVTKLESYSFMRGHDNNFVIHKTVRNYLLNNLHGKKPKYLGSLHLKAAKYADEQLLRTGEKVKFQDEEWAHWSLEKIYHLVQADPNVAGKDEFFKNFSSGLWELEFDYCLRLVDIVNQPLRIASFQGLEQLKKGCNSCKAKEHQQAINHFSQLLTLKTDSPYFEQMIHDTLGDLYQRTKDYESAIKHYKEAIRYFQKFDELQKVATTQLNIASCLLSLNKSDQAISLLNECIAIRETVNDNSRLTYPLYLLGSAYLQAENYPEAIGVFEKCCEIHKELKQELDVAFISYSLGDAYQKWGRFEQAIGAQKNSLQIYERLGQMDKMARGWIAIGSTYRDWKKYPESIDAIEKSLEIYQKLDQQDDIAITRNRLGVAYSDWGKFDQALEQYRIALQQYEKMDKKDKMAEVMIGTGQTYLATKEFSKAKDAFKAAQGVYLELGDEEKQIDVTGWLGGLYQKWGKYDQALVQYQTAFEYFAKTQKKLEMAVCLLAIGHVYKSWGKQSDAMDFMEQARKMFSEIETPIGVIPLLGFLAITYREWGKYDEALEQFHTNFEQLKKQGKKRDMSNTMVEIGRTYLEWGKYPEAVTAFEESQNISKNIENQEGIIGGFVWLGGTYHKWGKYEQAVDLYQKAILESEKLDKKVEIAGLRNMLGNLYKVWGKRQEAANEFVASRNIYQELDKQSEVASLSNQLGIVYREWGKPKEAIEQYQTAHKQFESLGKKNEIADVLIGIGRAFFDWEKYSDAIDAFEKSQTIYQELNIQEKIANILGWIGNARREQEMYEQALEQHQTAYKQHRGLDNKDEMIGILIGLGRDYLDWWKLSEAITKFEEAERISNEIKNQEMTANVIGWIGDTYRKWGKYDQALEKYHIVLKHYEDLGKKLETTSAKVGIGRIYSDWGKYPEAIDIFQQAQRNFLDLENQYGYGNSLDLEGYAYHDWGRYDTAIDIFNRTLEYFVQINVKEMDIAEIHFLIGKAHFETEKYQEALFHFETSQGICVRLGYSEKAIYRMRKIGETFARLGRHVDAKTVIMQGLQMSKESNFIRTKALSLSSLVKICNSREDLESSRKNFSDAVDIYSQIGNPMNIAESSKDMAYVEERFGDKDKALALYTNSAAIYRDFNRLHQLAKVLRSLGKLQKEVGIQDANLILEESANLFSNVFREDEANSTKELI